MKCGLCATLLSKTQEIKRRLIKLSIVETNTLEYLKIVYCTYV